MAKDWRPAAELEAEVRAINATDWEPMLLLVRGPGHRGRSDIAVPGLCRVGHARCRSGGWERPGRRLRQFSWVRAASVKNRCSIA
jgi:hypothetical protein